MRKLKIAIMMVFAAVGFVSCSSDNDDALKIPQNSLIGQFWEGYEVEHVWNLMETDTLEFRFTRNIHTSSGNSQTKGELFSPTSQPQLFVSLLNRYGDTGMTGRKPSLALNYTPHAWGMEKIRCVYVSRKKYGALTETKDLSDSEIYKIRFKSFAGYIRNGYKSGGAATSPWHVMTFREFNSSGPHYLMDVERIELIMPETEDIGRDSKAVFHMSFLFESGFEANFQI